MEYIRDKDSYLISESNQRIKDSYLELIAKYNSLSFDELNVINTFLKHFGNFEAVRQARGISLSSAKEEISNILYKLGLEEYKNHKELLSEKLIESSMQVKSGDSLVVTKIKEKLIDSGGKAVITLLKGDPCEIWFDKSGRGLVSPKIPPTNQLIWEAFDAAVEVVISNGSRAPKGNARSGAKLGSKSLPLNSVEGYIAHKVHGVQIGETAFGPGFVIAAVLDWADICKNQRGFLSMKPAFLEIHQKAQINQ